ncbi:MAG: GumC family protein [Pseudomonadota bacterium]
MFDKPKKNDRHSLLTLAVDNDRSRQASQKPGISAGKDEKRDGLFGKKTASKKQSASGKKEAGINAMDRQKQSEGAAHQARPADKTAPVTPQAPARGDFADGAYGRSSDPLIDPVIIAKTMWRWRAAIAATTIAGGVIGAMTALSQPKEFTSYTQVLIDPREIRLVERDLTPEFLSNEGALAIVDSQLEFARSTAVLEKVIERTNLDQDPEFNGTADKGIGLIDGISVIRSLFAEESQSDISERVTIENLRDALDIDRESSTFVLSIGVTSQSASKAALLANEHAQAFIERQSTIEADTANSASAALQQRLAALQNDVSNARRQLADFRTANNLFGETGDDIGVEAVSALNATLVNAKAETAAARARAQNAQGINVSAVLNGAVPSDLTTPTLTTFRAQYASLRQNAAGLEETLGPRHPRLAVAKASVESARQDIERELQRIIDAAQSDLERALQAQREIEVQLALSNAELGESSQLLGELRRLQTEVAATENLYQNALVRAREAGEIGALGSVNATVIAPAEPPLVASSTSRTVVTAGGGMAGFLFGAALAFVMGCINSFNARTPGNGLTRADRPEPLGPTPPIDHQKDPSNETPTRKASDNAMHHQRYPAYPVYAPTPQPQPQPQPNMAAAAQAMPGYPPQAFGAPVYAPVPQPAMAYTAPSPYAPYPPAPQPMGMHDPQPFYFAEPPLAPAPVAPTTLQNGRASDASNEHELEELRQSVNDIREALEQLVSSRDRRYG